MASVRGLPAKVPFELFSEHHMYLESEGAHSQLHAKTPLEGNMISLQKSPGKVGRTLGKNKGLKLKDVK